MKKRKKINLTVGSPALVDMIDEVLANGLAETESEAVNVLLRELYDCRRRTAQPQVQPQQQQEQAVDTSPTIQPTDSERLTF